MGWLDNHGATRLGSLVGDSVEEVAWRRREEGREHATRDEALVARLPVFLNGRDGVFMLWASSHLCGGGRGGAETELTLGRSCPGQQDRPRKANDTHQFRPKLPHRTVLYPRQKVGWMSFCGSPLSRQGWCC